MEKLLMSQPERVRLVVMQQVKEQELTVAEASEVLGLSYRQAKRVWRRYPVWPGDGGLVAWIAWASLANVPSLPKLKARILATLRGAVSGLLDPPWPREYLAAEGMVVDHETLRRWRLAQGKPMLRPSASAMARTQTLLRSHGSAGWFAS